VVEGPKAFAGYIKNKGLQTEAFSTKVCIRPTDKRIELFKKETLQQGSIPVERYRKECANFKQKGCEAFFRPQRAYAMDTVIAPV